MKIAFACWDNRIAPVFDTARQIHLIETDSGKIIAETQEALFDNAPLRNAARLAELDIKTLVCGAISRPLQKMVMAYGINVIPFVAGELQEVIQAWIGGALPNDRFSMPGCCGHGQLGGYGKERGQGLGLGMGHGMDRGVGSLGTDFTGGGRGMCTGRRRGRGNSI